MREIKASQISKAMVSYQIFGETKGREILPYQTIVYCERIIAGIT